MCLPATSRYFNISMFFTAQNLPNPGAPAVPQGESVQQRVRSIFQPSMRSVQEAQQMRGARPVSSAHNGNLYL